MPSDFLALLETDEPLAHLHGALDDPIERAAVEQLGVALGRLEGGVEDARRLAGLLALGGARGLPVGQLLDGVGADAELDEVQRHGFLPNRIKWSDDGLAAERIASANGAASTACRCYFAVQVPVYCATTGWPNTPKWRECTAG